MEEPHSAPVEEKCRLRGDQQLPLLWSYTSKGSRPSFTIIVYSRVRSNIIIYLAWLWPAPLLPVREAPRETALAAVHQWRTALLANSPTL